VSSVARDVVQRLGLSRGVCPVCVNGLDIDFVPGDDVWMESAARLAVLLGYSCDHCGFRHYLSVGLTLLYHPGLIAFFHDHGTDVTAVPHWELPFAMTDEAVTIDETDPWRLTFRVSRDGDEFERPVSEETLPLTPSGS